MEESDSTIKRILADVKLIIFELVANLLKDSSFGFYSRMFLIVIEGV